MKPYQYWKDKILSLLFDNTGNSSDGDLTGIKHDSYNDEMRNLLITTTNNRSTKQLSFTTMSCVAPPAGDVQHHRVYSFSVTTPNNTDNLLSYTSPVSGSLCDADVMVLCCCQMPLS